MTSNVDTRMFLRAQKNEITEYIIYRKLARVVSDKNNRDILQRISDDELRHYMIWKKYSGRDVRPNRLKVFLYYWVARILGITFGIKLMERGESAAQGAYEALVDTAPEARRIIAEENEHEDELIGLIDEERLKYVGSIVLGLNDALVELTGALAGLTLALRNGKLIAMAGLITGIAASFSMAASEYLSTKTEEDETKHPVKASVYTGTAYILTVFFLIFPYLIFSDPIFSLCLTLLNAMLVILAFTYYISIAKDLTFWGRFLEMAAISLGIALISFGLGYVIRLFFDIDI
ncbi:MAG: VIT1/CCC1 transporter family protein [Deltaproteobacteria bacterium]|nr:VIT1/CCC1 transporter family protein [Candidatus Zymogenaceae bacterium]